MIWIPLESLESFASHACEASTTYNPDPCTPHRAISSHIQSSAAFHEKSNDKDQNLIINRTNGEKIVVFPRG